LATAGDAEGRQQKGSQEHARNAHNADGRPAHRGARLLISLRVTPRSRSRIGTRIRYQCPRTYPLLQNWRAPINARPLDPVALATKGLRLVWPLDDTAFGQRELAIRIPTPCRFPGWIQRCTRVILRNESFRIIWSVQAIPLLVAPTAIGVTLTAAVRRPRLRHPGSSCTGGCGTGGRGRGVGRARGATLQVEFVDRVTSWSSTSDDECRGQEHSRKRLSSVHRSDLRPTCPGAKL
jgi:hypothetical protein